MVLEDFEWILNGFKENFKKKSVKLIDRFLHFD